MTNNNTNRIATVLLVLRLSVFLVMLVWTIDKFVRPAHAIAVFEGFYFIKGVGAAVVYALGAAELPLLIALDLAIARRSPTGSCSGCMSFHW